ncbi:unnamed protein product [Heligmosomoides polygyrus]|uniref:AAA_12 domain-containing protein n=1 Tax=Heligmosomoides polygyrus TaxID=6339 RepID=A0A183GTS8_HELPZ|nr:unnamed protein product [Heligmosomoides polygyrus]
MTMFYKERTGGWRILHAIPVDLSTVDATHGREKNVVVLLKTTTDFQADAADLSDDPHRMNVALTRCRQGQLLDH